MIEDRATMRYSSVGRPSRTRASDVRRYSETNGGLSPIKRSPERDQGSPKRLDPFEILLSILLPQHMEKATVWLAKSTEKDIQGLRIIGQIMKHKGVKTFRKRVGQSHEGLFDFSTMTLKKANAELMRLNYQSAYGKFFGRLPALMDLGDV